MTKKGEYYHLRNPRQGGVYIFYTEATFLAEKKENQRKEDRKKGKKNRKGKKKRNSTPRSVDAVSL